jgi:ketosteroid isomerase-like protein
MSTRRWSTLVWICVTISAGAAGYKLGSSWPARAAESAAVLFEADRAFDRETNASKAAIRELMAPLFSRAENSLRWEPIGGDIAASGELGYTFGHSTSRRPNASGETADYFGKYVTIWKKQADGSWKVVLDIGNRRPGP